MDVIKMAMITVVGVGLEAGQLTFNAAHVLKSGAQVILHTGHIGQRIDKVGVLAAQTHL